MYHSCYWSAVSNLNNETASWGHKRETSTKTIFLEAFSPNVLAADEIEQIRFVGFTYSNFHFRNFNTHVMYGLILSVSISILSFFFCLHDMVAQNFR